MSQPNFAELYERWLVGPLFRPWALVLLEKVRPHPGQRVLDLACGTGIVARLARPLVGETGTVTGVDSSPLMLGVARQAEPAITWVEGNALRLPFDPGSFDVGYCQQGLQFFPDRPAAVLELKRVVVGGGRVGLATWRPLAEIPGFLALHEVAERHLGPVVDLRHGFGDAEALERLLVEAGFREVRISRTALPLHFADPSMFFRLNAMALVGMSPRGKTLGDPEKAAVAGAIAAESAEATRAFADGTGITFELSANLASAVA